VTRAIAYLRVSTGLQAEKGMGLEVQRQAVTEYAAASGLELVDVVQEAASGGVQVGEVFSWEHRPVLLNLIERAKGGEFDVLLVAKFDRLSRDDADVIVRLLATGKHPVRVFSTAEDNGDSDEADLMRGVVGQFAKYERKLIRRRLQAGKQARKNQGRHVHGRIPYGYITAGQGKLEPEPDAAAIVQRIFAAAKNGQSLAGIARSLNEQGIASPHGRSKTSTNEGGWSAMTVSRILSNLAYTGERYGVKKAHEAIITRRTYNAVQAALLSRSRPKT
jgi:site-specific DNA recombinase